MKARQNSRSRFFGRLVACGCLLLLAGQPLAARAATVPASGVSHGVPVPEGAARAAIRNLVALHPATHARPITVGTPLPVLPSGSVLAPALYPLQATASSVTVSWTDYSTNELGFKVFRRDLAGNWRMVYQVGTRDVRGTGGAYTWADTSTNLSGQCYMVAAYNANTSGGTSEECTVRPDPSRFPQLVPGWAPAWSGLSDVNDGTGQLVNVDNEKNLEHGNQTFGVDLIFGDNSLWRVEAQGGPHLMKGEAVALKVWGGGWLAYGNQTFGVDLQLSPTPVYEWYAIGLRNDPADRSWAGADLTDGGTFALWNSSARDYLVAHYQTWGVSLDWASKIVVAPPPPPISTPVAHGVRTEQVFNCGSDQQPVEVWLEDLTAGGQYTDEGTLDSLWDGGCSTDGAVPLTFSLPPGHLSQVIAVDTSLDGCHGNDPIQAECLAMITNTFTGDANGYTRTDTVFGE